MAYQSEFTGEQMEAAFRRISNMITGSLVITASMDGGGYGFVYELQTEMTSPKVFTSVRGLDHNITDVVCVTPEYNVETGTLLVWIHGPGIVGLDRYEVSYLLIE